MKIFVVGGFVRDKLLGITAKDKDYVVVGASVEAMLRLGFKAVGKDFPVFLHPQTHEEYALARTERKITLGYQGFTFYTSPDITLEEDLRRRDLTINALAMDEAGQIYDYFNGQQDLANRILRHTSPAFLEDPLRVLRLARFMATLSHFSFAVAPETLQMIALMPTQEFAALSCERILVETKKALNSHGAHLYWETLVQTPAFAVLFGELQLNYQLTLSIKLQELAHLKWQAKLLASFLFSQVATKDFQTFAKRYNLNQSVIKQYQKLVEYQNQLPFLHTLSALEILKILKAFDFLRRPELLLESLAIMQNPQITFFQNLNFTQNKPNLQGLKTADIIQATEKYQLMVIENAQTH